MIREVSRTHATIQASRNGRPRMSGVARLTKNGPTMRARNGTTASQRMLRMDEDSCWGENLPPAVVKIYLRRESSGEHTANLRDASPSPCTCRKSNSHIQMKSAKNWRGQNTI